MDVGVAPVLENGGNGLVDEAALRVLADHPKVVILDRILVGVQLERAVRRLEFGCLEGFAQRLLVLDFALEGLDRGVDHEGGIVALRGKNSRQALVLPLEFGDEFPVGRIVQVKRPVRGVEDPEHGIAHAADHVLVRTEAGRDQLDVLRQAGADELLDEIDAHAAGQEDVQGIRLGGAHLGELGRIVELAELGVDLVGNPALVEALESGERVLAGLVIWRDEVRALVSLVGGVLACRLMECVVRPGGGEKPRIALFAGQGRWGRVRAHIRNLRVESLRHRGKHDVGENDAREDVDLVQPHVFFGQLLAHFRLELVVADLHLDRQSAELAAVELDREVEGIADIHADRGIRAGQRRDEPDLDLVGGAGSPGEEQRNSNGGKWLAHGYLPRKTAFYFSPMEG